MSSLALVANLTASKPHLLALITIFLAAVGLILSFLALRGVRFAIGLRFVSVGLASLALFAALMEFGTTFSSDETQRARGESSRVSSSHVDSWFLCEHQLPNWKVG